VELARSHVLDYPLTQWADGIGTHGKLLSEIDNTSIFRARGPIADALDRVAAHANKAPLSGPSRSDFVRWHMAEHFRLAAFPSGPWGINGRRAGRTSSERTAAEDSHRIQQPIGMAANECDEWLGSVAAEACQRRISNLPPRSSARL
jgi:hypothetical protein